MFTFRLEGYWNNHPYWMIYKDNQLYSPFGYDTLAEAMEEANINEWSDNYEIYPL